MQRILFLIFILILAGCSGKTNKQQVVQSDNHLGEALFNKNGCQVCHSMEGKDIYGPPLNDLYQKHITVIRDGKEVQLIADRKYLKKAISDPRSEKVKGYHSKDMPETFFSEKEVETLVDYIISMGNSQ